LSDIGIGTMLSRTIMTPATGQYYGATSSALATGQCYRTML